jgi:hypothetical protein
MPPIGFAGIWRGRMHYAWIVLAVMFSATLAGVGVRAAPGVMIVPLQRAFVMIPRSSAVLSIGSQANTEPADSSPWHMKVDAPARLTSPG